MNVKLLKKIRRDYKVIRYIDTDCKFTDSNVEIYRLFYKGKMVKYRWFPVFRNTDQIEMNDWRLLVLAVAYKTLNDFIYSPEGIRCLINEKRGKRLDKKLGTSQSHRDSKKGTQLFP